MNDSVTFVMPSLIGLDYTNNDLYQHSGMGLDPDPVGQWKKVTAVTFSPIWSQLDLAELIWDNFAMFPWMKSHVFLA